MCNLINWTKRSYVLDQSDALLQTTPVIFDASVRELFWPLLAGARLVMTRPDGHKDLTYLCETIQRNNITAVKFVPSMLQAFLGHPQVANCSSLLHVGCGGRLAGTACARLPRTAAEGRST